MRRLACITAVGILSLMPVVAAGETYEAHLTALVDGHLEHGFSKDVNADLSDTYTATDALSPLGVDLPYVIETNRKVNLSVYAAVSPFVQQKDENQTVIPISSVQVDGQELQPLTGKYVDATSSALENGAYGEKSTYLLFDLDSVLGQTRYEYTIHISANQEDVKSAPAGRYVSSVTLSLEARN